MITMKNDPPKRRYQPTGLHDVTDRKGNVECYLNKAQGIDCDYFFVLSFLYGHINCL
jgi:hypothetical protein